MPNGNMTLALPRLYMLFSSLSLIFVKDEAAEVFLHYKI